jgi:transposase
MTNLHSSIPLAPEILNRTPPEVIELLLSLLEKVRILEIQVEELKARLNQNSSNSNKPPSSDSPFPPKPPRPQKAKKSRKRKGHRQQCMRPTELVELFPQQCSCACREFEEQEPYYIHQVIELPEIKATVSHVVLYRGRCRACGRTVKAHVPHEQRTGFGPRITAC